MSCNQSAPMSTSTTNLRPQSHSRSGSTVSNSTNNLVTNNVPGTNNSGFLSISGATSSSASSTVSCGTRGPPGLTVNTELPGDNNSSLMTPLSALSPPTPGGFRGGTTSSGAYTSTPLTKRESYKDRKKTYQKAKKKVAEELLTTISDPTVVVAQDWLKIRGSLKGWTKVWCELKPGLILLYKSPKTHKSGVWVGTILLNVCEVIERPSKKNGFCFKLFHPLEQSIWASRGPKGETFGALIQPLPTYFLIFRAPSEASGRQWMEAIELSYRCSSLLVRNTVQSLESGKGKENFPSFLLTRAANAEDESPPPSATLKLNESEIEKHFNEHGLDDEEFQDDLVDEHFGLRDHSSDSDSDIGSLHEAASPDSTDGVCISKPRRRSTTTSPDAESMTETDYVECQESEEFGTVGDQTEEVADENKSLLWSLLKQVRPGMDLSKVVLPTFILEPRSFLEKLSDYYYHVDILSQAGLEDDPFLRMKLVTQWYLSGFYKKPKGLKKPYNPILGETFRCFWHHPDSDSRTFYLAEQVSHHPPISAFYVTNRKAGFCIHGSILAKSKFYGNSVSAVLEGAARLSLLSRGEDYILTMPYAHCKGILLGTLSLELGGKVELRCEKTGYTTEIEFKLKPFLGGQDYCNLVVGKIRLGKETLATIEGHWDTEISIKDKKTGQTSSLWAVNPEVKGRRLKRFTVPFDNQEHFESEKLWNKVSIAIKNGDQVAATEEKTVLEDAQRKSTADRKLKGEEWNPRYFVQDILTGEWIYKHIDSRPWDPRTDIVQQERQFVIQTKTRHRTPVVAVRTNSVVSIETAAKHRVIHSPNHQRMNSIASKGSGESSPESRTKINSSADFRRKESYPLESTDEECKELPSVVVEEGKEGGQKLSIVKSCASSSSKNAHRTNSTTNASILRELRQAVRELSRESTKTNQSLGSMIDSVRVNQQEIIRSLRCVNSNVDNRSSSSLHSSFPVFRHGNMSDVILVVLLTILAQFLIQSVGRLFF